MTYNADLADQLGNLLQRVVKMVERYCDSQVPPPGQYMDSEQALIELAASTASAIEAALGEFALHRAIEAVRVLIVAANKYVIDVTPWSLAKAAQQGDGHARERLATTLYVLLETLRLISHYLAPFLPQTAAALATQLGQSPAIVAEEWACALRWGQLPPNTKLLAAQPLFPKQT